MSSGKSELNEFDQLVKDCVESVCLERIIDGLLENYSASELIVTIQYQSKLREMILELPSSDEEQRESGHEL
jgi:hypothetical protein